MGFHPKPSSFHADRYWNLSFRNRHRRLRTVLAAVGGAFAEYLRMMRDHDRQLRMSESELRDIGLHRVESAAGIHIVSFGDAGW
jgi:uncharacterized protein YjiS (DUF1127 family)